MTNYIALFKHYSLLIEACSLSLILGIISNYIVYRVIKKYYHPYKKPLTILLSALGTAAYILIPLAYFCFVISLFDLTETYLFLEIAVKIAVTIALSLSAVKLLDYIDIWTAHKRNQQENLANFGMLVTRAYLLKKVLKTIIVAFAVALILLNFPVVKEIGKGILISASVIGGVIAFAAQKIITNLFLGMDLILNKPIKIGDNITINSEGGTIEKITLNQIHLRTWDLRLIVYPLSYFMDNPFQNLSYVEQGLRGTVFLYTDYKVNMEQLREGLKDILYDSPLWDKKTSSLQMTEVSENTIQLRAVVSAKNSDDLWNLRCHVREEMVAFIQRYCPEIIPKKSIQWDNMQETQSGNTVKPEVCLRV